MLAQNFKTPDYLQISDAEFESLVTVLGMLERGELVHGKAPHANMVRGSNEFNMATTLNENEEGCGTVACICGWAHVVSGRAAFRDFLLASEETVNAAIERMPGAVRRLFRIHAAGGSLYDISPEQAATALRNFLTLGEAYWGGIPAELS